MKTAVLEDMKAVGKEAGLKSFEQVSHICWNRQLNLTSCKRPNADLSLWLCHVAPSFQVKDLHLHPEMFSVANGLLTPTLKSRRADIRRVFQEQISDMYSKTAI